MTPVKKSIRLPLALIAYIGFASFPFAFTGCGNRSAVEMPANPLPMPVLSEKAKKAIIAKEEAEIRQRGRMGNSAVVDDE